jgi:hypothetical protein
VVTFVPRWRDAAVARQQHADGQDRDAARAWTIADFVDLFAEAGRFDPESGEPCWQSTTDWLDGYQRGIAQRVPDVRRDAFIRAACLAAGPLRQVLEDPRTRLRRAHVHTSPERARALDARSMAWLARQPGRDTPTKLGARGRLLAVVRETNVDVPANRFVRRLTEELRWRLEVVAPETRAARGPIARELVAIRGLCVGACDAGGALADARTAVAPVADNVILGDRRYATLWRVWLALRALDEDCAHLWTDAEGLVCSALAWALVGALRAMPGAELEERWVRHPGDVALLDEHGVRLLVREGEGLSSITVRRTGDGLCLERVLWGGRGVMCVVRRAAWTAAVRFDDDAPIRPGHGHPALVTLNDEGFPFEASRVGVASAASWMVEKLAIEPTDRAASAVRLPESPWLFAGIDLAGVRARIVVDERDADGHALVAIETARDGRSSWVGGDAAARWSRSDTRARRSGIGVWRNAIDSGVDGDDGGALGAMARAAIAAMSPVRAGARAAFAVPDGLDEISQRGVQNALDGALPAGVRRVWRSVAAATAWRTEDASVIADGQTVVVLDLSMPRFGVAILGARTKEEQAEQWYWERPVPVKASSFEVGGDALDAVKTAVTAGTEEADALIVEAAMARAPGTLGDGATDVIVPSGEGFVRASVDPEIATRAIAECVADVVRRIERDGTMLRAVRSSRDGVVHLLLVGGLLSDDEAATAGAMLRTAGSAFGTRVHVPRSPRRAVARGLVAVLRRSADRLPTWEDILPRLSLEVTANGSRREIEVFPRSTAKAGASIPHVTRERLRIPAGERSLRLPLLRNDDGREATALDAVIEHPSMPLGRDIAVRLESTYSAVDDGFRLVLKPVGSAPFTSLDVRWARHDATPQASRPVIDEAPTWPAVVHFTQVADEVVRDLEAAARTTVSMTRTLESRRIAPRRNTARRDPTARQNLIDDFASFQEALVRCADAMRRGLPAGRGIAQVPEPLQSQLRSLASELTEWILRSRWADERVTELRSAERRTVERAARAVASFRGGAPESFVRWTFEQDDLDDDLRWRLIGRTLDDGQSTARRSAQARLAVMFAAATPPGRAPIAALADALWGNADYVYQAGEHLDAWLHGITARLTAMEEKGRAGPEFTDGVAVLLGLLRLRGTAHAGAVSARRPEMHALADRIRRVERLSGGQQRPRLRVSGAQSLADVTANALRGEVAARIEMIDDEG